LSSYKNKKIRATKIKLPVKNRQLYYFLIKNVGGGLYEGGDDN
jgi:hypothetical protein